MDEALRIKFSHYIIGGTAIVSAIAWNTAVKTTLDRFFPHPQDATVASIVYAVAITILLMLLIYALPDTTPELPRPVQKKIKRSQRLQRKSTLPQTLERTAEKRLVTDGVRDVVDMIDSTTTLDDIGIALAAG